MQFRHFAAGAAFAVTVPAALQAQLGGLVRKAKEAATNKVVERQNLKPSNAFGTELTPESLESVLRGLAAVEVNVDQTDQLRIERQRIDAEWAKSSDAHEKDRQAYEDLRRKTESCQDNIIRTRANESQTAYMARMKNDPAEQSKMVQAAVAVTQKLQIAQQKGDTLEAKRLMLELAKTQGIDAKADSAAAIRTCGPVPAKPAWLAEEEALRAKASALDGRIRDAEGSNQSTAAKGSGMTIREYSMARERVLHWWIEFKGGTPIQAFGGDERKLLEGRRSDIAKVKRALEGAA